MFEKQGFRLGAFTKTNELFVGRMAMLGIASSTLGELLTGKGALGQLGLETGLPVFELDWTILAVVGFNLLAALWPVREGDKDARGSGSGGTNQVKENTDGESTSTSTVESNTTNTGISKADFARLFSIKSLASKEREVFVGRVAQIGFAASLLGEGLTGKGILAQFNVETGIAVGDLKIFLAVFVVLTLIASVWDGEEEKGQPTN
jgi:photosystem II protein